MAAPVGRLVSNTRSQLTRGLPINKDAILDQIPTLGLHPIIVVADRGQPLRLNPVCNKVDPLGAKLKFTSLVRGKEAGASTIGFPAQSAVQFRGMARAFVDGEP